MNKNLRHLYIEMLKKKELSFYKTAQEQGGYTVLMQLDDWAFVPYKLYYNRGE